MLKTSPLRTLLAVAMLWVSAAAFATVEVNQANEAELDSVRGLGPDSTARILKARESGVFASWADLMARVKGIKPATASKLSNAGLLVNGLPYPVEGVPPRAP